MLAKWFFLDSKTEAVGGGKPKKSNQYSDGSGHKIIFWKNNQTKLPILKLADFVKKNKDNQ